MAVAAVARWGVAFHIPQEDCSICLDSLSEKDCISHPAGGTAHVFHRACILQSDVTNPDLGCPLCKLPNDFSDLPVNYLETLAKIWGIFQETVRQTLSLFWNYLQDAAFFSAIGCLALLVEINPLLPCIAGALFGTVVGTFLACALQAFVGDFLLLLANRCIEKLSPHPLVRIIFRVASAALSVALTYFLCSRLFFQTFHLLDTYISSRSIEVLTSQDLFLVASLLGTIAGGFGTFIASLFKWTDRIIDLP